jgi:hypothetical protein
MTSTINGLEGVPHIVAREGVGEGFKTYPVLLTRQQTSHNVTRNSQIRAQLPIPPSSPFYIHTYTDGCESHVQPVSDEK